MIVSSLRRATRGKVSNEISLKYENRNANVFNASQYHRRQSRHRPRRCQVPLDHPKSP
jgi:hypothetical protein